MKRIIYFVLVMITGLSFACTRQEGKQAEEKLDFQTDTVGVAGIQRMQTSKNEQTVKFKGKDYHISIQRMPSDTLPHVKNGLGDIYVDNQIYLKITREKGEKFFTKTFTKNSFSHIVSEDFLKKSILEGMVFDKVSDKGLILAASVSFPQTDLYVPISLTISADGKMTMEKENILEEDYLSEERN